MDFIFLIGIFYVLAMVYAMAMVNKRPDLSFWLMINMYFNPGGYLTYVIEPFLGRFDYQDILILFILYAALKIKTKIGIIKHDKLFSKFIRVFAIFLFFYIFIYGAIIPFLHNDYNFSTFLLKNRRFYYGIILLFSVYLYTTRGVKYLYLTTLFVGLITLLLFWTTLITQIPLIQFAEFDRYAGSGMMRIGMNSYGVFDILFPIAAIVLLISRNRSIMISYKRILYIAGSLMLLTLLITLTRRVIIDVIGSIIIIMYLISKLARTNMLTVSKKIMGAAVIVLFIMFIVKPNYVGYLGKITTDTFLLLTTGQDTRGVEEKRVTGGGIYDDVFSTISDNIFFGTGYTYFQWEFIKNRGSNLAVSTRGLEFGQLADAAQEIPLVNMFFSFGIIGFLFLLPLYMKIIDIAINLYRLAKYHYYTLLSLDPLLLIFSIFFITLIIKSFTYNLWNTGDQFIGAKFQINAVWFGLGFGLLSNLIYTIRNKSEK